VSNNPLGILSRKSREPRNELIYFVPNKNPPLPNPITPHSALTPSPPLPLCFSLSPGLIPPPPPPPGLYNPTPPSPPRPSPPANPHSFIHPHAPRSEKKLRRETVSRSKSKIGGGCREGVIWGKGGFWFSISVGCGFEQGKFSNPPPTPPPPSPSGRKRSKGMAFKRSCIYLPSTTEELCGLSVYVNLQKSAV